MTTVLPVTLITTNLSEVRVNAATSSVTETDPDRQSSPLPKRLEIQHDVHPPRVVSNKTTVADTIKAIAGNRTVTCAKVEMSSVKTTTRLNKSRDVQTVFMVRDCRKYKFMKRSPGAVLRKVRSAMIYQNSVVKERSRLLKHWIGSGSEYTYEQNTKHVKLGVESDDREIVKLYWRLINTVLEFNRVRKPITRHSISNQWTNKSFRRVVTGPNQGEVHKHLPLFFQRLLSWVSDQQCDELKLCYINHLNPKTCLSRSQIQLTFYIESLRFFEAKDRVSGTRHAMVRVEFTNPILIFLGRVVKSDFAVLDSQSGYVIEMEDNVFGVDKAKLENNILYSVKCSYRALVERLMKEKLQEMQVTTSEQRFLDWIKTQTTQCNSGFVHYVPEGFEKFNRGESVVGKYVWARLRSVDTGNGNLVDCSRDAIGRLQVFIANRLHCFFYSDGGFDCIFYVNGGVYVTDDDRRITRGSINENTADNVHLQKLFKSSPEAYDLGFDFE